MPKPVINIAEIELEPRPAMFTPTGSAAQRFDARIGPIAPRIGARKLGYNITAVPPGKCAFPRHNHHVNEEMFFILQGTGELRFGHECYPVREGDIIACPPGGNEVSHQILNTGADELRYLAVSTRLSPEIADYPDSGKFGVLDDLGANPDGTPRRFLFVGREGESIGYWEGE